MSKFKKILAGILTAVMAVTSISATTLVASAEDTDDAKVVWVNGKDVKTTTTSSDGVKSTEITRYKTAEIEAEGTYSGGKWTVAVTTSTVADATAFVKLFDEKGKLTADGKTELANAKKLASAKIKEGTITVTAGKEGGKVKVWLYEVKGKKVVNTSTIKPTSWDVTVKVAPSKLTVQNSDSKDVKSASITVGDAAATYKVAATAGSTKTPLTVDTTAKYTVTLAKSTDSQYLTLTDNNDGTFKVEAKAAGAKNKAAKVGIVIKNTESGKTVKFTVTVNAKAATSSSAA